MITKNDFKRIEMPKQVETFTIKKKYTEQEMEYIKRGHLSCEMDDKWNMYYEDDKLFMHRSWSGCCIYIIDFSEQGNLVVTVNRNHDQYLEEDIEIDRFIVLLLINELAHIQDKKLREEYYDYLMKTWQEDF